MSVVQGSAKLFDVRSCIRSLPAVENRRKRKENLRDSEQEDRRAPESARKKTGVRHEGHYTGEVYRVQMWRQSFGYSR